MLRRFAHLRLPLPPALLLLATLCWAPRAEAVVLIWNFDNGDLSIAHAVGGTGTLAFATPPPLR
jgi:hypothetical protein